MKHPNQIHPWHGHKPIDAGMTERAIRAGEGQARKGDQIERAERIRGMRNPVTNRVANYELPPAFVSEALPRLEALLKIGQWSQLHATIDQLALEYELRAQEASTDGPRNGTLAAKPVVWLGLPTRVTNLMEQVGAFTVGALVERFPTSFVGLTNCGPEAVKAMARALVKCAALTTEEAALRVQAWYAAMEIR